jgi:hypothetical protein
LSGRLPGHPGHSAEPWYLSWVSAAVSGVKTSKDKRSRGQGTGQGEGAVQTLSP